MTKNEERRAWLERKIRRCQQFGAYDTAAKYISEYGDTVVEDWEAALKDKAPSEVPNAARP